jgi:hypothetical protein
MSRGIVRSLYLAVVPASTVAIVQTLPLVRYLGAYPTSPLSDATAGAFAVDVSVWLANPGPDVMTGALLTLSGAWDGPSPPVLALPALASGATVRVNATLQVPAGAVQLWWTADTASLARRGQQQPLYAVNASITFASGAGTITDSRRIGFRVFTLVTGVQEPRMPCPMGSMLVHWCFCAGNDTVPESLAGVDGSGNVTMRFKLNGANIYARGADIIPMVSSAA